MPKELDQKMKVKMVRQTVGENRSIMKIGSIYEVPVKFGQRLIWAMKAVPATEADEAAAKKSGPLTSKDLGSDKAVGK